MCRLRFVVRPRRHSHILHNREGAGEPAVRFFIVE
jgi:hypothetical protein